MKTSIEKARQYSKDVLRLSSINKEVEELIEIALQDFAEKVRSLFYTEGCPEVQRYWDSQFNQLKKQEGLK